jgi:hypothetical protein
MIKKLLINSLVIFYVILSVNITALSSAAEKQNDSKSDKGSILLRELLLAHRMLANSKQSDPDNSKIAKSIVLIGQKKYEIVSFEFKNTLDTQAEETFEEYAKINNLFYMRSTITKSQEEESSNLEIFDSKEANLEDEISFYISLRSLE